MKVYRKRKKRSPDQWIRFRISIVGVLLGLCFVVVIARTVQLQVLERSDLVERAEGQYKKAQEQMPSRGTVFDRNHEELAASIDVASVCAYPQKMSSPNKIITPLARALDLDRGALRRKLQSKKGFVWIKRQITPGEEASVKALEIAGVDFISERRRYYPMKTLASQVIGFCGTDGRGLEGLEYYYESYLSGRKSNWTVFQDALGRSFRVEEKSTAIKDGHHIILTIDKNIQHITEKALSHAVRTHSAKSGIAVVMAPSTGAVLAIAHAPSFNPNVFRRYKPWVRRNRAITDSFEPGSTFKIFLAAAALESGQFQANSQLDCEDGKYQVGKHVIHDVHSYQLLSFQDVLKYSSNIGAAKIGVKIGPRYYYEALQNFGFGTRTGVDCPGETRGAVIAVENWTEIDAHAISFGQGISVSALQLASAVCATANGGVLMRPHLVQGLEDAQGNVVKAFLPTRVRRVISVETAGKLSRMLERVVAKGGTGQKAALRGYRVAGKTGTAQKVDSATKTYAKGRYVATFVGFTPVRDPALAIVVVLDEPEKDYYGGVVAAPVFKKIAEETLQYLNVPPDLVIPHDEESITTAMEGTWMG